MFSRRIPSALRAYSTSAAPEASSQATHHLITLVRSPIALPERYKRTLTALGLKRLRQSVVHPFSPVVAGRILKVKELVQVLNVTEEEGRALSQRRRAEGSGVEVTGRAFGGGKGSVEVDI